MRQSFSHGRSKAVVVEKAVAADFDPRRGGGARRSAGAGRSGPRQAHTDRRRAARPRLAREACASAAAQDRRRAAHFDRRAARGARPGVERRAAHEVEDRRRQEAEAEARRDREVRDRHEREAAEARKREESFAGAQEATFRRQSEDEARRRFSGGEPAPSPSLPRNPQTRPRQRLFGASDAAPCRRGSASSSSVRR